MYVKSLRTLVTYSDGKAMDSSQILVTGYFITSLLQDISTQFSSLTFSVILSVNMKSEKKIVILM